MFISLPTYLFSKVFLPVLFIFNISPLRFFVHFVIFPLYVELLIVVSSFWLVGQVFESVYSISVIFNACLFHIVWFFCLFVMYSDYFEWWFILLFKGCSHLGHLASFLVLCICEYLFNLNIIYSNLLSNGQLSVQYLHYVPFV